MVPTEQERVETVSSVDTEARAACAQLRDRMDTLYRSAHQTHETTQHQIQKCRAKLDEIQGVQRRQGDHQVRMEQLQEHLGRVAGLVEHIKTDLLVRVQTLEVEVAMLKEEKE